MHQELFDYLASNELEMCTSFLFDKFSLLSIDDLPYLLESKADVENILSTQCRVPDIKVKKLMNLLTNKSSSIAPSSSELSPSNISNPLLPDATSPRKISLSNESVRLLSSINTSGLVSSGSYVVVDGLFYDGFSKEGEKVKVKIGKASLSTSLKKEYQIAKALSSKSPNSFIKAFGLLKGDQIIPFDGSGNDLSD